VVSSAAADRDGVLADIDGPVFAAALRHAVGLVVTSMGEPVPGTIVSVLQDAAGAAEHAGAGGADLAEVVAAAADAAAVALDKTTAQLDVLAEAGVVDAGGRGLLVLLDAMSTTLTGRAPHRHEYLPSPPHADAAATTAGAPQFEVMYLLSGCDAGGVETLRERLDQLGESVAIAASADGAGRYSVHVHADDAGAAVEAALSVGTPSRIQITSLSGGAGTSPAGGWSRERAVLAVVDGDGAEEATGGVTHGQCEQVVGGEALGHQDLPQVGRDRRRLTVRVVAARARGRRVRARRGGDSIPKRGSSAATSVTSRSATASKASASSRKTSHFRNTGCTRRAGISAPSAGWHATVVGTSMPRQGGRRSARTSISRPCT